MRSRRWFDGDSENAVRHRSVLATLGFDPAAAAGRPVIGICYPRSEFNNCELAFDPLVPVIKRGVTDAGGLPLVFGTMSLGAELLKPSDLLYRNLVAMEVEETIRSYPIDGVVLLCNCDKTTPAQLMAAASADIPAIQFNAGPKAAGTLNGRPLSSGTDFWKLSEDHRAGRIDDQQWRQLDQCLSCSVGACNEMGTTATMTALSEALGMMPLGTSTMPANDTRRLVAAENVGRQAVALVREDLRPGRILGPEAFENAIRVLGAMGGSTNALIHLVAIAGRRAIDLPLQRFDELIASTPLLVNLKPSGDYLVADLHDAGGVPAVMKRLLPLLHADVETVNVDALSAVLARAPAPQTDVVGTLQQPIGEPGALAVLFGTLAPRGAIIKTSAADPRLREHTGPAVVFDDYADMLARVDRDDLDVTADSVLVLRGAGPVGGPGMPEWGQMPIPRKLLRAGVRDICRISDARMSGTSFGAVVLHVAPEAAVGGPLAIVEHGDRIRLSLAERRLDLLVDAVEIQQRMKRWTRKPPALRGYLRMFHEHVLQADCGCDFDYLRPETEDALRFVEPEVGRS